MNIDFSLVLVVLSAVTGVVWLFDLLVLSNPRKEAIVDFLQSKGLTAEEFNNWLATLDESGSPLPVKAGPAKENQDPVKLKHLQTAFQLNRYPILVDYSRAFFPILFAVLLLRSFLFEPFQIPTGSMIPTLNIGDFIVVNKFAYGLRLPVTGTKILSIGEPRRGDVMVFVPPHVSDYYIKRVIGLPGDHIQYKDGVVYVNDQPLPQEKVGVIREKGVMLSRETVGGVTHDIYTAGSQRFSGVHDWQQIEGMVIPEGVACNEGRCNSWLQPEGTVIPPGQYFMMGDNRDNSLDSRFWGPASEARIVGKAVAVWMHKDTEHWYSLPSFSDVRFIENSPK